MIFAIILLWCFIFLVVSKLCVKYNHALFKKMSGILWTAFERANRKWLINLSFGKVLTPMNVYKPRADSFET